MVLKEDFLVGYRSFLMKWCQVSQSAFQRVIDVNFQYIFDIRSTVISNSIMEICFKTTSQNSFTTAWTLMNSLF